MIKLNCGLSYPEQSAEQELRKIQLANKYGVDYVSIISIDKERTKRFWELVHDQFCWEPNTISLKPQANFTLCSAPLYESVMFNEDIMETIKRHYSYGVRAMTFHTTPVELINNAVKNGFIVNSRGGIFSSELDYNPIHTKWAQIVMFCLEHHIEIFIGTSLRPGACDNELSEYTIKDLEIACEHYDKIIGYYKAAGKIKNASEVPAYIETLGHVRAWNLKKYEEILGYRKICAMGPLFTDAVNGFDELNAIIGYTYVKAHTTLNLHVECMLSRKEHIELPNVEDVEDEIKKWKVAELVNDVTKRYIEGEENLDEKKVLEVKGQQRTQCSAHYNIFGAMDIIPTCNVCGNLCPLTSEKLRKVNENGLY